jgi:hypothetical protein
VQLTEAPEQTSPREDGNRSRRSPTAAFIAFIVAVAIAFGVLMWLARGRWFKHDEWDFLAAREATSLHDLFAPHVVHWSTLPILAYRLLWNIFGLRTYVPYVFMSIASHLAVAVMLRVVMRRAGVRSWTATVIAVAFMFFGAGYENIILAFGMTFSMAIVLGLVQLVLSDHDGGIDRRDYLGLLAGFAALLFSGIAVTMVFIVGVASLVRRGWRAALFHTAPLAGAYIIWYAAIGSNGYGGQKAGTGADVLSFAGTIANATFHGLSQFQRFGWVLLLLVLALGLALAWSGQSLPWLRRHASLPAACLVGCAFFIILTSVGRWDDFQDMATPTRYIYVAGSLLVVPVGVAADAIMRRWRYSVAAFACLLAVSLVGNIRNFPTDAANREQVAYGSYLLTLPRLPMASQIPNSVRPDLVRAPWVTMGWLRSAVKSGRAPVPGSVDPVDAAGWEVKLALRREQGHSPTSSCQQVAGPTDVRLARGASIKAPAGVDIVYTAADGVQSDVTFPASQVAPFLVAYAGPLDVRVTSHDRSGAFTWCDKNGAPVNVPPSSGP